jgi:hypothetical protein
MFFQCRAQSSRLLIRHVGCRAAIDIVFGHAFQPIRWCVVRYVVRGSFVRHGASAPRFPRSKPRRYARKKRGRYALGDLGIRHGVYAAIPLESKLRRYATVARCYMQMESAATILCGRAVSFCSSTLAVYLRARFYKPQIVNKTNSSRSGKNSPRCGPRRGPVSHAVRRPSGIFAVCMAARQDRAHSPTRSGDVRLLKGITGCRLRIGDWGAIFIEDARSVTVIAAGNRKGICD